ncbi:MAG: ParB/RepB/Spo0J family partition protein, partial [Anaerolineae bacterium]|nr:ParB/RepB/Spo0J family partition protein [Anaerolineae bacterium]
RTDIMRQLLGGPVALEAIEIPVGQIVPNPHQPRDLQSRPFDPEHNEEDAGLVDSIAQHGVIQPVGVIALPGGTYQLIYGERRWRACLALGKEYIPALVKDRDGQLDSQQQAVLALIENLQRADLSAPEIANGLEQLQRLTGYTWDQIAHLIGRTTRMVRYYRAYNELEAETRRLAAAAGLNLAQVGALASAPLRAQNELARQAIELGLPAPAIQKAVNCMLDDPAVTVDIAVQQAASAHRSRRKARQASTPPQLTAGQAASAESSPGEPGSGDSPGVQNQAMSAFHEHAIANLLAPPPDAAPQEKREWTLRARSLREQVTGFGLDVVDTRHAALLMRHNRNLPAPAAVGMAQSLRGTRTGGAIGKIEAALDTLGSGERIVVDLTENQREAVLAISAYLRHWLDDFDAALRQRK